MHNEKLSALVALVKIVKMVKIVKKVKNAKLAKISKRSVLKLAGKIFAAKLSLTTQKWSTQLPGSHSRVLKISLHT